MKAFKKITAASVIAVGLLAGSAGTANASVTVCSYLDARPTVAGVEDLVGIGVTVNGWTAEYAGWFIGNEVSTLCPRHLITIQAFVNKWTNGNSGDYRRIYA